MPATEIMTRSTPLLKALAVNDQSIEWATINTVAMPFSNRMAGPGQYPLGIFDAGAGGELAPNRILIHPYCEGPAGSQFSMRVYAWRNLGEGPPQGGTANGIWIPSILCELACTASNQPGQKGCLVLPEENFCDTITLTSGALGLGGDGEIIQAPPDQIASAILDIRGCRRFMFVFKQADAVAMNCLYTTV